METKAQLKINLKNLRLLSMYDNIDMRIEEAITNKMSYIDFLQLLTQDEIDRRKHQKRERLIKKAKFGKIKYISEFDFSFNPGINRQQILSFTSCEFIKNNQNIIFHGPAGVGKTLLSKAIGIEACCRGYNVLFTRTARMLDNIYSGKADNTFYKKLDYYIKQDLLILDDFGMTAFTDHMLNILNEIISERCEHHGSIIITSNRNIKHWADLFQEPVISSTLLDRLFQDSHLIHIDGKSYRTHL